ncbi:MAG: hypothetical protein JEY71_02485 [Sphaerochaeta sp.]|nr:hypothetical protein [Sphaerochaeta sp.]
MSKKFWLKHMTLHKSPGFAMGTFPPVEKLGEHLNVIWGPNAVGKSTLSRAMRALIWGNTSSDEVEAEGLLGTPDSEWSLALSRGKLIQTRLRDNQTIPLPGRNDELSESYWFSLPELLQEDDRSTDAFLRQVRTKLQGGVDLDRACEVAGGIASYASGNIAQAKQVKLAREELKKVLAIHGEHQGIQDRIGKLHQELQATDELSAKKTLVEEAQILLELSQTIESQEHLLSLYSPSIGFIDKSSPKRLQELLSDQNAAKEEQNSCIQTRDELRQGFIACAISEEQLKDIEKPSRIENTYSAYKDALSSQKKAQQEFSSAREALLEWEAEHSWLAEGTPDEKTLESYVETLKTLAQECEPLRCDVDAKKRLLDELGEYEAIQHPVKELSLLQMRLSDWMNAFLKLRGTPRNKALQPGTKKWLLLLMVIIGALTSYLGIAVQPVFSLLGVVLMLFSVVLLIPSATKNNEYAEAEKSLAQAKQEVEALFKQLDSECPASLSPEFCYRVLAELSSEIAIALRIEQVNQRRKLAEDHLGKAVERLGKWALDWRDAAKALSLKDDEAHLEGAQFFHFAERLQKWSSLRVSFVDKQGSLAEAQKDTAHALSLLHSELDTQECEITSLKAKRDTTVRRFHDALSLQTRIAENAGRLLKAQQQLLGCEMAIKGFWEKIHVAFGDETELSELVAKLDQWNDLRFSLKHNQNMYDKKGKEVPKALQLSHTYSASALSDASEIVVQEQKMLEQKREELGGLRSTFDGLKFGSDLSTAQKRQESALQDLETVRSEQVMARMIHSLASDLKDESEKLFQPQVLKHASAWLSDSTNHRYTLSANNAGFFATDTIMAKNYNLDELSSGTRVQLLFSIRMAFITMQEETSGVRLPIFLDELLANSDDDRALAITEAIGTIAQERQVFYVTAQRDEVEKLKTIVKSTVTVIPLEDVRRDFRVSQEPLKRYVYSREEILPAVADYQEYGKALGVSGPSVWGTLEALHSWHLLTDSDQLYDFLQQGLTHVGQLISAKAVHSPTLSFRLELLKAAQQKAQQGRSKVVHLSDLEDPALDLNRGAKFWVQIQEVVGSQGCTGKELLEAIQDKRIQRFTDTSSDMLSTWLFDNRFDTDTESKSAHAILDELFVEFESLTVGSEEQRVVLRYLDAVIG